MATDDDKERHKATMIKAPSSSSRNEAEEETVNSLPSPFAGRSPQITPGIISVPSAADDGLGPTKHRDPVIGAHVSGYVVKGRLGSGGMGIVYEGEQPMIGKRVAIKVLRPEVADNPDVVQRLVAEARAVNQVGHRGIIDVFAFGELPDGRQCIVMEYLDGESLDAILQMFAKERRLMPMGDVLIILDEILSALAAAHTAGVIHRDLKPSNIFLCRQRDGARYVKLLDFGIAKLGVLGGATPVSRASLMVGTPSYMAPEQAKGGNIGPAMDLYAVGVMAFEMFTGRLPFIADSVVAVIMAHQQEAPPRPSSVVMSLPDAVDEMVLKLMSKAPEDRYRSADEVRQVVHNLRKEFADTTTKRMQLEITISEREKAAAIARRGEQLVQEAARKPGPAAGVVPSPSLAALDPVKSAMQPMMVTIPPAAKAGPNPNETRADGMPLEAMQTNLLPPRMSPPNTPQQLAQTDRELSAHVAEQSASAAGSSEQSDIQLPKSNRGLIVGLAVLVLLLIGGVAVVTGGGGGNTETPKEPIAEVKPPPVAAEPPKPVAEVAKVDPPPTPTPMPVEPPKPVEPVQANPVTPEPVAVKTPEPEPVKTPEPVAVKTPEPVAVKTPEPVAVKTPNPTPVKKTNPTAKLQARIKKLETRLIKATQAGNSVDLYVKQVQKIQGRLDDPTLGDEERDRLESAISRLEQSTDF
ncbi:MAG: protein kinase [Archangium sp.]|nr:protein kinase [Archangium sp.]